MILKIIEVALLGYLIYIIRTIYITNLNIISLLKKINNKIAESKLNLYSYSSSFELSDTLDPIGSSFEETITDFEDFTMPIIKDNIELAEIVDFESTTESD